MNDLPPPSPDAAAHSERVVAHIRAEIERGGGWIGFARYMELALYAPALGYYMAGARKLGADGDFVTAPELAPLFGHTLARQVAQVLAAGGGEVLEIGAGSGALAASLLEELERLERLPENYLILELSPELRGRSRDTLAARVPHLLERVAWLNVLPPSFTGVVVGNEVLDAIPVNVVRTRDGAIDESGVAAARGDPPFEWADRPAAGEIADAARALALPEGYRTEIGLVARRFVSSVANMLEHGIALFVDYGFPRVEYYHPQRREGTLMCHYRHRAHCDPFFLPGLQDITAHVDFTAMAEAAHGAGADVLGYATQAQFLINCGITEVLQRVSPDARAYLPLAAAANRITSPAEMGELFKAFAFGRGVNADLIGFRSGDKRHTL
jgi:SAM-dependent MidA family methyltransferase